MGLCCVMVDEDIAYTPHPTAHPRVTPMAIPGAASKPSSNKGVSSILAVTIVLGSVAMGLSSTPRGVAGESVAAAVVTPAHPFSSVRRASARSFESPRSADSVVPFEAAAVGVENRASSPLPVAGDALGVANSAAPAAAPLQPTQQFHSLTSFDGNRVMTSGNTQIQAAQPAERAYIPPAPVVWNHPLQWISVHQAGL